jgi:hypothetical protein
LQGTFRRRFPMALHWTKPSLMTVIPLSSSELAIKRYMPIIIGALVIGAPAFALPVRLECVTDYPAAGRGRTYQIVFDESTQTVARDDGKPVKARISETLITWREAQQYGTETWTIDRLNGAWRIDQLNATGVGGKCTAPPPRQF